MTRGQVFKKQVNTNLTTNLISNSKIRYLIQKGEDFYQTRNRYLSIQKDTKIGESIESRKMYVNEVSEIIHCKLPKLTR